MRRLHAEGPGKVEEEHPLKLVKEHHRYGTPSCAAFARDMQPPDLCCICP